MTFDPYQTIDSTRAKNLADVLAWLTTTEDLEDFARQEYRLAVEWAARHIRKPTSDILADRDAVLSNFSDQAYTTDLAKTFEAFKRKRRNLSCAIRGATGAIAAGRERRKRSDGWSVLIQRVKLLTDEGRGLPGLHVKALIALDVLADQARMFEFDTRDLCAQTIRQLEHEAPDLSESLQNACDLLDRLPSLNDATLDPLLPAEPIKFRPRPKRETFLLSKHLEDELAVWVSLAAKGDWIETDEEADPDVDSSPYRTAARKIISTALEIGCVKLNQLATIAPCFDKGVLVEVVKALRRWHVEGHPKAIKPKTAREYLEKLKKILEVNGECSKHVRKILRKSKWLKAPEFREGRMPQRTRSFCRRVVRDLNARMRFLSLHIYFRKQAIFHLKAMATEPARAAHHRKRARSFVCAASVPLRFSARAD